MVMRCCVLQCRSKVGLGLAFHEFPVDNSRWLLWFQNIPMKNSRARWDMHLVCGLHFRVDDYNPDLSVRRLKPTAVPSIFPGSVEYKKNQDLYMTCGSYPPKNITVTGNSDNITDDSIDTSEAVSNPCSAKSSETVPNPDNGQICRLCAKTGMNYIPLFLEEETNFALRTKILKYLHIEVKENDHFPKHICLSCSTALEAWDEFAITCYDAEKNLRKLLHIKEQDCTEENTDVPDQISEEVVEERIEKTQQSNGNTELIGFRKCNMRYAALVPVQVLHELSVKYMKNVIKISEQALEEYKRKSGAHKLSVQNIENVNEISEQALEEYKCKSGADKLSMQNIENVNEISEQALEEYKCKQCAVSFLDFSDFNAHEFNVHSRIVLPCKLCPAIFYDEGALKMHEVDKHKFEYHMKQKHDQLYKKCPICNNLVLNTELKRHLKSHSNFCKFCLQIFSNDKECKAHKKCHFPSYLCDMCGKMLSRRDSLLNHIEIHIKKEKISKLKEHRKNNFRFTCDLCGLMFHKKYDLKKHMAKHLRKHFICEICGKVFIIQWCYKLHVNMHSKSYKCDMCMKDFKNQAYLSRHIKYSSVHRGNKCQKCGKLFLLSEQLSIHVKDCNPAALLICHVCGLGLKGKSVFHDHILTHNVSKRHKCDFCNKQFVKKANKIQHERLHHTGERPYSCVFCDKLFVSKCLLKRHKRIHNLIYKCRYCSKRFSKKFNLEFHEQTHKNTDI